MRLRADLSDEAVYRKTNYMTGKPFIPLTYSENRLSLHDVVSIQWNLQHRPPTKNIKFAKSRFRVKIDNKSELLKRNMFSMSLDRTITSAPKTVSFVHISCLPWTLRHAERCRCQSLRRHKRQFLKPF